MSQMGSAPVSSTRAELRRRAAVLSYFAVPWLGSPPSVDNADLQDFLAEDCTLASGPDGQLRLVLAEDVRERTIETASKPQLRAAWEAVAERPSDATQWALDKLVVGVGSAPPLIADLEEDKLRAVATVSRWLSAAGAQPEPDPDLHYRIRLHAFTEPLRALVGDYFVGRRALLEQLDSQLQTDSGPITLIHGVGGIGKSALVAKHMLDAMERRGAYVIYLNFDDTALDARVPATLLHRMSSQLAAQVAPDRRAQAELLADKARDLARRGDRGLEVSGREAQVMSGGWTDLARAVVRLAAPSRRRKLLVVVDTFEQVQRREISAVDLLRSFLDEVRSASFDPDEVPSVSRHLDQAPAASLHAHTIIAGRAPEPILTDQAVQLEGLERSEATKLLQHLAPRVSDELAGWITGRFGSSPLTVRLAAAVVQRSASEREDLLDLKLWEGRIDGELYRRLLNHIPDKEVRKLAHPGLTVRRITPAIIEHVLARPCGVHIMDEAHARKLFYRLGQEAMLVEWSPDRTALIHRPDIRALMLDQLRADRKDAVKRIHWAAVRYYRGFDDLTSRTEELYHRLMLDQSARTLDARWIDAAAHPLALAIDELPPRAKAYLAAQHHDLRLTRHDLQEAEDATWASNVKTRVQRLVAAGQLGQASELLMRRRTKDGHSLLPEQETEVLELLGRLGDAAAVASAARRDAARQGRAEEFARFSLSLARVLEKDQQPTEAAAVLDEAREARVDDQTRLRLVVARLALARRRQEPEDVRRVLGDEAIELFERLGGRMVSRQRGVLRDLAAEVGDRSIDILVLALTDIGVDPRVEGQRILDALRSLDRGVSAARGLDQGVVAGVVKDEGAEPDVSLRSFVQLSRGEAGKALSTLIREFRDDADANAAVADLSRAIAANYRSESDVAFRYTRHPVKEIRLALVCSGGVSLAIYMHGVTKEIHKLLLASLAFGQDQERNPFPEGTTQHLYWERLRALNQRDRVRTRVVVDIVSGTSAGGINGVYLAKAIARNASQDALRNLWFEHGDIGGLLRFPRWLPTRLRFALFALQAITHPLGVQPPLRGDEMCRLLYDALAEMDGTSSGVEGATLVRRDESVELMVTLTDLKGHRRYLPIADRVVHDKTHRHVMRFRFDHQADQFGKAHNGPLAFAARATSCFPGAFPPLSTGNFQAALGSRPFDPAALEREFFPAYAQWGETMADSYFIDGGVLDDFPFGHAIDAIARKRASTEVTRWLLYIEADPASPLPPASGRVPKAGRPPRWLATIWSGLSRIPAREPILDDLTRLRDFNQRAAHMANLTAISFAEVHRELEQLPGELLAGVPPTAEEVGRRMGAVHDLARNRVGAAYLGYIQLKLQAVSRWLADLVADTLAYPPESSHASFVLAVMHEWTQHEYRIQPGDGELRRQTTFLDRFDMPYRERRLRFVIRGLNDLYATHADHRPALDEAKAELYDFLDRLRDAGDPAEVRAAVGDPPFHVFNAEQLAAWVEAERSPNAFREEHAAAIDQLVERIGLVLGERLGSFSANFWTRFTEVTQGWDPAMRVGLIVRWVGFPLWDTLLFPVMGLIDIRQLSRIMVKRIGPDDARRLPVPPEEKLQGVALHHFGAFFKRSAREHDYLWGRLDAVEQLLGLLDPGLEDAVYRQGFEAVFAEEQGLAAAPALREQVAVALERLGYKVTVEPIQVA
jgi:patatin-related protein